MTSWERGEKNENIGNRELSDGDASNNLDGIARKVGGEIEEGVNNIGDTLSGKQDDLKGNDRNMGSKVGDWAENRGQDIKDATR